MITTTQPTLTVETEDREVYRAGQFHFDAEGNTVTVTRDTPGGIITVNVHTYRNHETACEMAWKMACRQMRA